MKHIFPIVNAAGEQVASMKFKPSFVLDVLHTRYENHGFNLSWELGLPKPSAKCSRIKSKARFAKYEFYYNFKSVERLIEYCTEWIESVERRAADKAKAQAQKAAARANMVNPFKVGQVFFRSWGYEQTNINFYQIVEVKERSVMLQAVKQEVVREAGFMCEYVKPSGELTGKPFKSIVGIWVNGEGKASYYIKAGGDSISEYEYGENGVYQSHYA